VIASRLKTFVMTLNWFSRINGTLKSTTSMSRTINPKVNLRRTVSSSKKMCPKKTALIAMYIAEEAIPKIAWFIRKELYSTRTPDRIERIVKNRYLSFVINDSRLVLVTWESPLVGQP